MSYCIEHDTESTLAHEYFMHPDEYPDFDSDFRGESDYDDPPRRIGVPSYRYGGPNED